MMCRVVFCIFKDKLVNVSVVAVMITGGSIAKKSAERIEIYTKLKSIV
jgi:hypothetical protein